MQVCEECGRELKPNDECYITLNEDKPQRVWHAKCLEQSLTPIQQWYKGVRAHELAPTSDKS